MVNGSVLFKKLRECDAKAVTYGLLTLAHILNQVLFVNLPEFSHLEGRDFAAVQKTKQKISANMRNFHDLPETQDIRIVV